jgi:hypothetical protein
LRRWFAEADRLQRRGAAREKEIERIVLKESCPGQWIDGVVIA